MTDEITKTFIDNFNKIRFTKPYSNLQLFLSMAKYVGSDFALIKLSFYRVELHEVIDNFYDFIHKKQYLMNII